jgi:hypothetical protein
VLYFMIRYISEKPLGGKTLHDTAFKGSIQ